MRIVVLSMNFAPELTGIGKYSGEMVDGLVARGHEVVVVCAPPYYPQWQVQAGHSQVGYRIERPRPGMTVLRCPMWLPRQLGGLQRLLHLASFALSSLLPMLLLVAWRPAVVFAVAPALFCAPAAWLCARLAGAKAWLLIQDFETEAAFELGLLRGRFTRGAMRWAERWLLRGFDRVSTLSARMLRRAAAKGVPLDRLERVPNWVDVRLVNPLDRSLALRGELGIGVEQTVCLFSGTLNRKQGLHVLAEAAHRLAARRDIVLVICGQGEMQASLRLAAAGAANVLFIDLQPTERYHRLLNMADIHLLPQLKGAADLVMPSKLTGMLASGRPVVAGAASGSEIATLVEGRGCVVEAESAVAFATAILALADDPALRTRLGAEGRRYSEKHLDAAMLLDRLDNRLRTLARPLAAPLPIARQPEQAR